MVNGPSVFELLRFYCILLYRCYQEERQECYTLFFVFGPPGEKKEDYYEKNDQHDD